MNKELFFNYIKIKKKHIKPQFNYLVQSAQLLLENNLKGVILQSQIKTESFLNGNFIIPVYGKIE